VYESLLMKALGSTSLLPKLHQLLSTLKLIFASLFNTITTNLDRH
jgi:hypothetical protein